jgi:tRNA(adenine34) deaminase
MPESAPMDGTPAKTTIDAVDHVMMERCIALAMRAVDLGEYPYAAVICRNGEIVCESINSVVHDHDVTHHAEVVAISEALRRLKRTSLEDCTIYANAEPCALCCYAMRETRIGRVVFGVPAPLTGGITRWNILADTRLSDSIPEVFAPPPVIVPGFMREQIESEIARRAPLVWEVIRARNIFGGPLPAQTLKRATAHPSGGARQQLMSFLRRRLFDYFGRK